MSGIRLGRRLELQSRVRVADGAGGFSEVWQGEGVLWAEVRPGSGREADGEETVVAEVGYRITVRGAPADSPRRPRPDQRFREAGRTYRILAVTEREAGGRYLLCFAREETAK